MAQQEKEEVLKIIIIGDSGCGKTCILHQFISGKFKKTTPHTIGVEFGCKTITLNNKKIKLQIWDTAGQERFRSVTRSYYRGAHGAIVLYDITSLESLEHVSNWIKDAKSFARTELKMLVVGNKKDMEKYRMVTTQKATGLIQQVVNEEHEQGKSTLQIKHIEASALTGENVDKIFTKLCKLVLKSQNLYEKPEDDKSQYKLQQNGSGKGFKCYC